MRSKNLGLNVFQLEGHMMINEKTNSTFYASGWCPVQLVTPYALSTTRFLLKSDSHETSAHVNRSHVLYCTCHPFTLWILHMSNIHIVFYTLKSIYFRNRWKSDRRVSAYFVLLVSSSSSSREWVTDCFPVQQPKYILVVILIIVISIMWLNVLYCSPVDRPAHGRRHHHQHHLHHYHHLPM